VARARRWERGGREFFLLAMQALVHAARGLTGALQNGRLQRYLMLLVLMALAAGSGPFLRTASSSPRAYAFRSASESLSQAPA
jgi:hypothetical protein